MVYSGANDKKLPAHVQKLGDAGKKKWVNSFNASLGNGNSESKAIKIANGLVQKEALVLGDKGLVPSLWDVDERQVSKNVSEYNPFGATGGKGCATCQFFISPDSCLVVAGDISPTGMSKYYTPVEEYVMEPMPVVIVEAEKEDSSDGILTRFTKFVKSLVNPAAAPVLPFRIEKSSDGYRVYTIFTNNFQDNHDQIISEAAHKEYVAWVDQTKLYPEFHLWHAGPESRFGQADFVDYVDGFMVASGPVDKDKEYIAEALKEQEDKLAVSHGFYGFMKKGGTVYDLYRPFEISPLPLGTEANKWTSFNLVNKETLMPFSDAKKAWLKEVAKVDDATLTSFESSIANLGKSLKAQGVEFKEDAVTGMPAAETTAASTGVDTSVSAEGNSLLIGAVAELTRAVAGISQLVAKQQETFSTDIAALKTAQNKSNDQVVEEALTAKVAGGGGFRASQAASTVQAATKEDDVAADTSWFFNTVMAPLTSPAVMAQAVVQTASEEAVQSNGASTGAK